MSKSSIHSLAVGILAAALLPMSAGCGKKSGTSTDQAKTVAIQSIGSDTMVNLAQAWAEAYSKVRKNVSVEVSGGGTGVGIAALLNGTADIANCSRKLEAEELAKAKAKGEDPKEFLVGYDGLAIFVHKDNPLKSISIEELSDIYREGGTITKWSQLGIEGLPGAKNDEIIRVSRQNNSGTYQYFRETVVGKKADFKAGSLDMNGSKDVVELVSRTPGAIGYSGLGYATAAVRIVPVSRKKGEPGVVPSIPTVHDKSYPIARPLFMYTPGVPSVEVKSYLDWILSPEGQKLVATTGYVPLV
jgi:phosphate transport system substrate-binding protein